MKKTLVILVSAVLVVSLWGCGESTPAEDANSTIGNLTESAGDAAAKAQDEAHKTVPEQN